MGRTTLKQVIKDLNLRIDLGGIAEQTIDDRALFDFYHLMHQKLKAKRKQRKEGNFKRVWYKPESTTPEDLYSYLVHHFQEKLIRQIGEGVPLHEALDAAQLIDIANLSMMLYHRLVTLREDNDGQEETR